MEPPRQELTLEESIKEVMHTLPPPIRHYLGQGTYSVVAQNLRNKYHLTAGQATVLQNEIVMLLMGVENPDEFARALVADALLDQPTVASIAQDVNTQIFIPLRAQMQNPTTTPVSPPARAVPPPAPRVIMPTPSYAPPRPPNPPPPLVRPAPAAPRLNYEPPSSIIQANPALPTRPQEEYITKSPKYVPPSRVSPRPPAPRPPASAMPARPIPRPITTPSPSSRQPISASATKLLEDHEEPSPSIDALKTPPRPEFKAPAARIIPPPPNLPGAMMPPPSSITPSQPRSVPPTPLAPKPAPPPTPRPPVQPYDSDPYREPIA